MPHLVVKEVAAVLHNKAPTRAASSISISCRAARCEAASSTTACTAWIRYTASSQQPATSLLTHASHNTADNGSHRY